MINSIEEAKRRLPLPDLMHRVGLGDHAKKSARCPFHEDRHASFSIFRNANGAWLFKCHAGCGEGDEITFLELLKRISRSEAIKLYLELAGIASGDTTSCTDAFTDKHVERLAKWRGYSLDFCSWLKQNRLVGLYKGRIAFPVHDHAGNVVAIHYRLKDGTWRYHPEGTKVRPLIIGDLVAGNPIHAFESYFDAFSFMDISGERSGIIVTRGAGNGALVAGFIPPGSIAYAWKQNDELKNGNRPGDEWLKAVATHAAAKVLSPNIPDQSKDLNDWTRAGATSDDLITAMTNARNPLETQWPDPEPIRNELRSVEGLQESMIPEPFRAWLVDIAHRMQCPIDFVAAGAVVMPSVIIGAGCAIRPKRRDDWLVTPNLWGGAIGRPSMLKTPALAEAFKPLRRLEAIAKEEYDAAMHKYMIEVALYNSEQKAIKGQMIKSAKAQFKLKVYDPEDPQPDLKSMYAELKTPDPPIWRRYKTNDATIEKISELLAVNPRGLLIFRDELIGLLTTWDKEGREPDRAFHLEAWNGNASYTTDRIGRGTIYTEHLCESIFGGIQPSKLITYLYQTVRNIANDGLLQRFQLLVYPDEPKEWKLVDEYPNHDEKNRAFKVIETLASMDFVQCGAKQEEWAHTPYFQFADDAQEFFFCWLEILETAQLRAPDESAIMLEHLGKYRSLMPSLALIFHLIEVADGVAEGAVTLRSTEQAACWCEYLETHARRIYGLVADINLQAASRLAQKIKEGALPDGFSARDVYRKEWSLLDTKELTQGAIEELVEAGWLREEASQPPENGRPALPIYRINPKLK